MFYSKAEILKVKRNNDLATMERMYYEDDPYSPNLYVKLEYARMLIQNRRLTNAKKVLEELVGTSYERLARFEFGRIAALNRDFDLAREHFYKFEDSCVSQYDKDRVHFELGKLEYESKKLSQSKKYFHDLIDSEFENQARIYLGRIYYQEEEFLSAQKSLYPVLKTRYSSKAKFWLGKIEAKNGNNDAAREYFEACVENKENAAYYELGKIEFHEFNYSKAEEYFEKSRCQNDYYAKTKYCLGKTEEAIKKFKELLGTKKDISARLYLSLIYIKDKNYEEAFKMIHDLITSNEIDKEIKFKIALILSKELNIYFQGFDYSQKKYYTYSNNQYIDYNKNAALEHIFINHIDNPEKNNFNKNVDVCELFEHIDEKMDNTTLAQTLVFNDIYFINYPDIGSNGENILKVVTLPGSKSIITMYPVENKKYYDDVNNINKTEELVDAKRKILLNKLSKIRIEDNLDLLSLLTLDEKKTLVEMFGLEAPAKTLTR